MRRPEVALGAARESRGLLIGWTLGLALYALVMVATFPAFRDQADLEQLLQSMPEEMQAFYGETIDMSTYAGWMNLEFLAYLPVLLSFMGVTLAARALVGEEEEGTADLLLSQPLPRWRIVLEKYLGAIVSITAVALAIGLVIAVGGWAIGERFDAAKAVGAGLYSLPLVYAITAMAFAASATFRRRRTVYVAGTFIIIGLFLLNTIGKLVDALDVARKATLFYQYEQAQPMRGGFDVGYLALGLVLSALFVAVAVWRFVKKDIAA